ncbi:MAG: hypothetical protein Q8J97_10865, partial [Flavobacteriaceae bacterium]|nr:hypothetical protein [Flavobacteriaceae bacterium]
HFGGGSHLLKEYEGGYAVYTKAGGVLALQHPDLYNPLSPGGSKTPTQFIPVGQGFFVTADADGGNVVFKNSQRTFVTEVSGNSVFTKAPKGRGEVVLGQATQSQTTQAAVENATELWFAKQVNKRLRTPCDVFGLTLPRRPSSEDRCWLLLQTKPPRMKTKVMMPC